MTKKTKILAIDDKKEILLSLKAVVNNYFPDYEFYTSLSGKEGIEIAIRKLPDCIILDIHMPEMDGYEVCAELKNNDKTKHIPIVFLTADYDSSENKIKGLELGADAFISKPFVIEELVVQIKAMLRIKRAEDILRNEKESLSDLVQQQTRKLLEYKKAVNSSTDLIAVINRNYEYVFVNDTFADYWNMSSESIFNMSVEKLHGKEYFIKKLKPNIDKAFSNETVNFESRVVYKKTGVCFLFVSYNPIIEENGEINTIAVTIRDITKDKTFEKKILLNNERLKSLVKISQYEFKDIQDLLDYTLEEAIKLTESKIGFIYFYNEAKRQFTLNTWSRDVMKECRLLDLQTVYDLDKTGCWGEAVRQKMPYVINNYNAPNEYKKGTPEGHIKLNKFLTIPVIADNKIVAVIGVANKNKDYTDLDIQQLTLLMNSVWKVVDKHKFQQQLIKAKEKAEESDKLKTAFLQNISHEIRTPMNGIIGFSQMLKKNKTEEKRNHYIRIIEESCNQLLCIVNDVIDISKLQTKQARLHTSKVSINSIISDIYTQYSQKQNETGIALHMQKGLTDIEGVVYTDQIKLYQTLNNLINNAFKFTNKGHIKYGYDLKDNLLEFFVEDTGIGIDKNIQNQIFSYFRQAEVETTRRFGGTGLGLSICLGNIELLEGKIWVDSQPNKGSTFHFTIPYNPVNTGATTHATKRADVRQKTLKKPNILVAEDEEFNFLFIQELLEDMNLEIIRAADGNEAIEICTRNANIDLVLMDLKMPNLNGYEATQQIKKIRPQLPVVAQTAFFFPEDRKKAFNAGCDGFLPKPIKEKDIIDLIRKYISK